MKSLKYYFSRNKYSVIVMVASLSVLFTILIGLLIGTGIDNAINLTSAGVTRTIYIISGLLNVGIFLLTMYMGFNFIFNALGKKRMVMYKSLGKTKTLFYIVILNMIYILIMSAFIFLMLKGTAYVDYRVYLESTNAARDFLFPITYIEIVVLFLMVNTFIYAFLGVKEILFNSSKKYSKPRVKFIAVSLEVAKFLFLAWISFQMFFVIASAMYSANISKMYLQFVVINFDSLNMQIILAFPIIIFAITVSSYINNNLEEIFL